MRDAILRVFLETVEETEATLAVPAVEDDMPLLASGLDSLGFAILVVKLEEYLGFDPFVRLEEAVYPTTFGEFVSVYEDSSAP